MTRKRYSAEEIVAKLRPVAASANRSPPFDQGIADFWNAPKADLAPKGSPARKQTWKASKRHLKMRTLFADSKKTS